MIPLPAFADNYIWMLHDGRQAVVVDPGVAQPVLDALGPAGAPGSLQLLAILVTHHHSDHVGGVDVLRNTTGAQVFGPARESIPQPATPMAGGNRLHLLGLQFEVIDVPGHTAGHVAYYSDGQPFETTPLLFCGDTLFSGGCGRLFEGTAEQMLHSLDRLSQLPGTTRVCCAHEYTLSNLRFAQAVEPDNTQLLHYRMHCETLRAQGRPTLPSTIAQERAINPFLRSRTGPVIQAARSQDASHATDGDVGVFAALRQWKDGFRG